MKTLFSSLHNDLVYGLVLGLGSGFRTGSPTGIILGRLQRDAWFLALQYSGLSPTRTKRAAVLDTFALSYSRSALRPSEAEQAKGGVQSSRVNSKFVSTWDCVWTQLPLACC